MTTDDDDALEAEGQPGSGPFDFSIPFPWSLLKLDLLEKYTNVLPTILGQRFSVAYVDLMAGEGYYETGDVGSAGRLAALAEKHRAAGRNVKVIAIEANDHAFSKLQANTATLRNLIEVRHAHWQSEVPRLLEELRGWFVFFFVDPMGIEEIPWDALKPIVERQGSELLINFNSSVSARLAGIVLNGGSSPALEAAFSDYDWRTGIEEARTAHRMHQHMGSAYMRLIGDCGHYITCAVPITKEGDRGHHKYHLVLAGRHLLAFEIMNDIVALQREDIRRRRAIAAHEGTLFPLDVAAYDAERDAELARALADSLAVDDSLRGWEGTIKDLRPIAFRERFALYAFKYYAAAITLLADDGQALVLGAEKRRGRPPKLQLNVRVRL